MALYSQKNISFAETFIFEIMKHLFIFLFISATALKVSAQRIVSGTSWFDQNGNTVNAHGANIIRDGDKWWMFGEYKLDKSNEFNGFSCYSSTNLTDWEFERMALPVQHDGILGSQRIGERPKVMKCPLTGKYVMLMHSDNATYNDQRTAIAISDRVDGEYTFLGPLLHKGKEMRYWDIGTFQDNDGTGYLLVNHGKIYRLADDYMTVDTLVATISGAGESPVMFRHGDTYFYITSNLTSWERNDNYYYTSKSVEGPWTKKGLLCPKGRLTWNSQCSFVLPIETTEDTIYMYMGDRWSYPHQGSAATYVWQPLNIYNDEISIPEYHQAWIPSSIAMEKYLVTTCLQQEYHSEEEMLFRDWKRKTPNFHSSYPNKKFVKTFRGTRIGFMGNTNSQSGYGKVTILSSKGDTVHTALVDFYSLTPTFDIRYISPALPKAKYKLVVEPTGESPVWFDKRQNRFGSTGTDVDVRYLYVK